MIRLVPYNEIVPQVKCPPKTPEVTNTNKETAPGIQERLLRCIMKSSLTYFDARASQRIQKKCPARWTLTRWQICLEVTPRSFSPGHCGRCSSSAARATSHSGEFVNGLSPRSPNPHSVARKSSLIASDEAGSMLRGMR
jgi:hypothetical protein